MGPESGEPQVVITKNFNKKRLFAVLVVLILLIVSIFGGWYLQKIISRPPVQTPQAKVIDLNNQLLQTQPKLAAAKTAFGKSQLISEEIAIASKRKELLKKEIEENPRDFLLHSLPSSIRKRLPDQVQSLIEEDIETEGTLTVFHIDSEDPKESQFIYELTAKDDQVFELHFADTPPKLLSGSRVKLKGKALDNHIAVLGAESIKAIQKGLQVLQTLPVITTGDIKTLVLLINFQNNPDAKPVSPEQIRALVFDNNDSVNAYFKESSYEANSLSGEVRGWYTIGSSESGGCFQKRNEWANKADDAARKDGINLDNYKRIVYVFPNLETCGTIFGAATLGGNPGKAWIFNNILRSKAYAHELGHNLGVKHAGALNCPNNNDYTNNCQQIEYGDPADVLGEQRTTTPFHFNSRHKLAAEWISADQIVEVAKNTTNSDITPLEQKGGVKLVKIPKNDTSESYFVEFRQQHGFDQTLDPSLTTGVSIRIGTYQESIDTWYVKANPSLPALRTGTSFFDKVNGITILQNAATPQSASISVTFGEATCVRASPGVTINPLSQTGSLGQTLSYDLIVTNQDSPACPKSNFNFKFIPPGPGWIESSPVISLFSGETSTFKLDVTSPLNVLNGEYPFGVEISNGQEPNYKTLAQATYIVYTVLPDLISDPVQPIDPDPTDPLEEEEILSFQTTISNQGTAGAPSSQTSLDLDVGNDGSPTNDPDLVTVTTGNLASGASESETWTSAWTATAGTHKLTACADATGVITELDENNDCKSATFTVAALGEVEPAPPEVVNCPFTVNDATSTTIEVGDFVTFKVISLPTSATRAEWSGTGGTSPVHDFSNDGSGTWQTTYGPYTEAAIGEYDRVITAYDESNNPVCESNNVHISVQSLPAATSSPAPANCILTVNDGNSTTIKVGEYITFAVSNIPALGRLAQWRGTNPDGSSISSPVHDFNHTGSGFWQTTYGPYGPETVGSYTRSMVIQDSSGIELCQTDITNITVNPGKVATSLTINGQNIPVNQYPADGHKLHLSGTSGQAQTFTIPVIIYYSDGTSASFNWTFDYKPAPLASCPLTVNDSTTTSIKVGEYVNFKVISIPQSGVRAEWSGSGGSVPSPVHDFNSPEHPLTSGAWSTRYGPYQSDSVGEYDRVITVFDGSNNPVCKSNNTHVSVQPAPAPTIVSCPLTVNGSSSTSIRIGEKVTFAVSSLSQTATRADWGGTGGASPVHDFQNNGSGTWQTTYGPYLESSVGEYDRTFTAYNSSNQTVCQSNNTHISVRPCQLSGPSTIYVNGYATYTIYNIPPQAYYGYWGGTNPNGSTLPYNYSINGFYNNGSGTWSVTYGPYASGTVGSYSRYVYLRDQYSGSLCTTNTIYQYVKY